MSHTNLAIPVNKPGLQTNTVKTKTKNGIGNRSLIYLVGNFLQKGSQFLLVPLFTRLLTTTEYGFYGALIALTGVLFPLVDLGISNSLIRFIHEYYDDKKRLLAYLKLSFWLRIISSMLASVICGVILYTTWHWLLPDIPLNINIILWMVLLAFGSGLTEFACAYYRATQQAMLFVAGKIGQTVLQLIFVVAALFLYTKSAATIVIAQGAGAVIAGAGIIFVFYVKILLKANVSVQRSDLKHNLSFGLPLIPHQLGNWLRTASDRIIMSRFVSLASVGIYQLGTNVGNILAIFITCLDMVYEPLFYRIRKLEPVHNYSNIFRAYIKSYLFGMGALCLALILFAPEVISILAPSTYNKAVQITPLLIYAMYLQGQYTLVVKNLFYHRKTFIIPFLTLGPGIAGAVANFLLLPHFGFMVVVWVNLLVYLITFLGVYFVSNRVESTNYPKGWGLICNIIIFLCSYLFLWYSYGAWGIISIALRVLLLIILVALGWFTVVRKNYTFLSGILGNYK